MGKERFVHQPRKDAIDVADAVNRKLVRHEFTEGHFLADQCPRERKVDLKRAFDQVRAARRVGITGVDDPSGPLPRKSLEDRHQPDDDELVRSLQGGAVPAVQERRDLAHAPGVAKPLAAHPDARDLGQLVPCHALKVVPAAPGPPTDSFTPIHRRTSDA